MDQVSKCIHYAMLKSTDVTLYMDIIICTKSQACFVLRRASLAKAIFLFYSHACYFLPIRLVFMS